MEDHHLEPFLEHEFPDNPCHKCWHLMDWSDSFGDYICPNCEQLKLQRKIMSFLPLGDENLKTSKSYLKMSDLAKGDNKLRFVTRPVAGWIEWKDKKPFRYKPENKPSKSLDPKNPAKSFWACYVWDYERNDLFILEITQAKVLSTLRGLGQDPDWGDFTTYDIKINKSGEGMSTTYQVTPVAPKPLAPKIKEAFRQRPVRLEALYEGKDPWNDLIDFKTGEIKHEKASA